VARGGVSGTPLLSNEKQGSRLRGGGYRYYLYTSIYGGQLPFL